MNRSLPYLSLEDGFLGIAEDEKAGLPEPKAVIIPFGLERTVSYGGGTAQGPAAMIDASHQVELFDEDLWCEPFREIGVATLTEPKIKKTLEEALDQLESIVESVLLAGKFPFTFGGEHSLTAGAIRPFAKRHKSLTILHFDAHADLRDGYDGEHYSHAAALRRVLDHPNIKLASFAIRNISASEIPFLEANGHRIKMFWAKDKAEWNLKTLTDFIGTDPIYISFDLDGFDASLMPATGTPEPGGVFWDEAMRVIKTACLHAPVVGADIVELAPIPGLHSCNFLAAKLAYKILAYAFLAKNRP